MQRGLIAENRLFKEFVQCRKVRADPRSVFRRGHDRNTLCRIRDARQVGFVDVL